MFDSELQNYYDVLDIAPDASQNDIRQAYFRVKAAYGKNSAALYSLFDTVETKEVLERIEQAFIILSNPSTRKEYDRSHGLLGKPTDLAGAPPPEYSIRAKAGRAQTEADRTAQVMFGVATNDPFFDDQEFSSRNTVSGSEDKQSDDAVSEAKPTAAKMFESRIGMLRRTDLIKQGCDTADIQNLIDNETAFRGEFFQKIREHRAVTLDELSEFTKISKTHLQSVEEETFTKLPAAVYLRGFVVQMAKALKIPSDKAATAYMDHYKRTFAASAKK